jgi:F-type H+-transporting ATPase subunit b
MLFDWFTIGAQVLNFVILVWLMKHFLYQPILHAIDEREKLIAKQLSDAKASKADAKKEHDTFLQKNQELDKQSAALLAKATDAANTERQRLMDEAKKASTDWSAKRHATLLSEEKNLHQAVSQRAQQEIFLIARKTLADLAGLDVEERMVEVFIRRLHEISGQEKDLLVSDARAAKSPMIVRSAFNILKPQRDLIEESIKQMFGNDTGIQFELVKGLICGIVLIKNDSKIAWSIDDYLGSMQSAVEDLLQKKKQDIKLEPKPDKVAKEASNAT